jgi:glyoxylase-like metal-dependent hydrolase (beta-lactamase superfamily II)
MSELRLGDVRVISLLDGWFRLDGGAMFGVVPKAIWEKIYAPDEKNRVRLALRPLLIETGGSRILVDTGMGDRWGEKERTIYGIERSPTLLESLAAAGVRPEQVDTVVLTHLHFDHVGGAVARDASGALVPVFPRAAHVIQKGEWEAATRPNERTRASYRPDDLLPLEKAGIVRFVEGDVGIAPGVEMVRTGGHNRDLCAVRIRGGGRTAAYLADLVPTTAHLRPSFTMGYDLYPLDVLALRKRWVGEAIREGWICFFEHDPSVIAATVTGGLDKPAFVPLP